MQWLSRTAFAAVALVIPFAVGCDSKMTSSASAVPKMDKMSTASSPMDKMDKDKMDKDKMPK